MRLNINGSQFVNKIGQFFRIVLTLSLVFVASVNAKEHSVILAGQETPLLGTMPSLNQPAPNFKVVDDKFTPVSLADFAGKTVLISAVPSLDTGVCALQTKRFNTEVSQFSDDVVMLTLSMDLPFAQKRFCQLENVDKVKVLSDSVWRNFGEHYGLIIKDRGLLARAIFIIDSKGVLRYQELVRDVSQHPDYSQALSTLKQISAQ
jgi:thioredoxin-dependent peroxiredoxin